MKNIWNRCQKLGIGLLIVLCAISLSNNVNAATEAEINQWSQLYEQSNQLFEQQQLDQAAVVAMKTYEYAKSKFGIKDPQTIISLYNLASIYGELGAFELAVTYYKKVVPLAKEILGHDSPDTLAILSGFGELYGSQGKFKKAEPLLAEVLRLRKTTLGTDHPETLSTMNLLAQINQIQGKYKKAEELLLSAVTLFTASGQENSEEALISRENLAAVYTAQARFKKAEPLYEAVLNTKLQIFGEQDLETLITMGSFAELYRQKGDFKKSEKMFLRTISLLHSVLGEEDPELFQNKSNLAALYEDMGNYSDAETLYKEVWKYDKENLGYKHPNTIIDQNNLAGIYRRQGKYALAEENYLNAFQNITSVLGVKHPESISIMNNLALNYENQGLFDKAEPLFKNALKYSEEVLGTKHPKTLAAMNNLALLWESQGLFKQSEPLYNRVTDLNAEIYGKNHSKAIASINNLGYLYLMQQNYNKAEPLFKRVFTQWEKQLGIRHQKTLKSLNNLARIYHHQGKLKKAESMLSKALKLRTKVLGKGHPDVIRSRIDLGALYITQKKYKKASRSLARTLKLAEQMLGDKHQYTFEVLNNYAEVLEKQKKYTKALDIRLKGFDRRSSFFDRVLWVTGENTRQSYIELHRDEKDKFLSLLAKVKNRKAAKLTLHASLERKGLLLKIASETQKIVAMSSSPKLSALTEKLLFKRKELSAKTLAGPIDETPDEFRKQLVDLEFAVNDLQAELGRASLAYRNASRTITVQDVFENMADDDVLVDYIAYRDGTDKLMAVIAQNESGKEQIQLVPLGELKKIKDSVSFFRDAIQDEDAEAEDITDTGKYAHELVWAPLLQYFNEKTSIYIVPDSVLHLLPFDAMINDDGNYLIESMNLKIISSARDIVVPPLPVTQGELVIFAGPDYDLDSITDKKKKTISAKRSSGVSRGMRVASHGLRSLSFEPLDGAEAEGKVIKAVSDKLKKGSQIFLQVQAEENKLRTLKQPPQVLHIATHGFFLKAEERLKTRLLSLQRGSKQKIPPPGDNPLLRAGLAFAGVNKNAQFLGDIDTDNDGVLTALEILGLNFSGTRLVVLSACETGVGEIHTGEGVYGLRRAFQEAGAESVVATLWPVSDEGTRILMTDFYDQLFTGTHPRKALKESQLTLINSEDWYHPYYWAPFVMVSRFEK